MRSGEGGFQDHVVGMAVFEDAVACAGHNVGYRRETEFRGVRSQTEFGNEGKRSLGTRGNEGNEGKRSLGTRRTKRTRRSQGTTAVHQYAWISTSNPISPA